MRVTPRLSVNTNDSALAAAVDGLGLTRVLSYQVAPQVQAGALRSSSRSSNRRRCPSISRTGKDGARRRRSAPSWTSSPGV